MFAVGLTGGVGAGKSVVAALFSELGAAVIDTDLIARALVAPGQAALAEIRAAFGDTVIASDGTLDRAALRRAVFADAAARRRLEAILHPRIRREVEDALLAVRAPYALVVIPLLVETGGYRELLDRVLVVDCPEAMQLARVMARSALTRDEAAAILAVQAGRLERLAVADDVIENSGAADALPPLVAALHRKYLELSTARY
jgi:dephospho-CoA kinase